MPFASITANAGHLRSWGISIPSAWPVKPKSKEILNLNVMLACAQGA